MTKFFRKLDDGIYAAERIILTAALSVMVIFVFFDVVNRHLHFFGNSFVWAKEVARFMMIWVGFVGASIATKNREHLNVGLREKLFPPHILRWVKILADFIAAVVTLFFAYLGYRFVMDSIEFQEVSMALKFPLWIVRTIIPVSLLIIFCRFFGQMLIRVREILSKKVFYFIPVAISLLIGIFVGRFLTPEKVKIVEKEITITKIDTVTVEIPINFSYTVVLGDNLSLISKHFYGTKQNWQAIYDVNENIINNPDLIFPGQVFYIPNPANIAGENEESN